MGSETSGRSTVCGECGESMRPVGVKTVKHLVKFEIARVLPAGDYVHCPNPTCDIVYARLAPGEPGGFGEVFRRGDIKDCALPTATERDRLVCYCFGYTVQEIEDDASSGQSIPAAIAAEIRAGNCACEVKNPAGH